MITFMKLRESVGPAMDTMPEGQAYPPSLSDSLILRGYSTSAVEIPGSFYGPLLDFQLEPVSESLTTPEVPVARPEHLPTVYVTDTDYTNEIEEPVEILPPLDDQPPPPKGEPVNIPNGWNPGTLENVLHADLMARASTKRSLGMIRRSLVSEYREYGSRPKAAARIGAIAVTQFADRVRTPFVLIPAAITETYSHTQNIWAAGAAGAGAFTLWSTMVGETLGRNMRHLPKTINTITRAFPGFTSFFTENLPGLEKKPKITKEPLPEGRNLQEKIVHVTKSVVPKAIATKENTKLHFKRGVTGMGLGSTAYVASTFVKGKEQKEVSKAGARLTLDTAAIIGSLGTGVTEGLSQLARHGYAGTARFIDDWFVSNNYFWTGVGLGSVYLNYKINKAAQEGKGPRILLPLIKRLAKKQQIHEA